MPAQLGTCTSSKRLRTLVPKRNLPPFCKISRFVLMFKFINIFVCDGQISYKQGYTDWIVSNFANFEVLQSDHLNSWNVLKTRPNLIMSFATCAAHSTMAYTESRLHPDVPIIYVPVKCTQLYPKYSPLIHITILNVHSVLVNNYDPNTLS